MINMNIQIMDVMFVSMTTWQYKVLTWVKHSNVLEACSLINAYAKPTRHGYGIQAIDQTNIG